MSQPATPALVKELEALCDRWLAPQADRLRRGHVSLRPKVINDALWGSIRLHTWEVAIVDTVLLQRLRFLRQLGVIHWVFPSASHSRFEHSLGVLHTMQLLLDGVERNSGTAGARAVDEYSTYLLRLAALLHDTGHSIMSHVSEPLVKELPGVKELTEWTRDKYSTRDTVPPSEAFTAVFVGSPAFRRFLGMREVGADFIRDVDDAVDRIARFVLGAPVPGLEFASLLMSGAYDADKLDYMPRDSLMSGIPCAVDVERLCEKVHVLPVLADKVADSFRKTAVVSNKGELRVLALSTAGERALQDVAIARTTLFEKVYYHQKVRALEATARRFLITLQGEGRLNSLTAWLEASDDIVLGYQSDSSAKQLLERHLHKRAFVIYKPDEISEALSPAAESEAVQVRGSERHWRRLRTAVRTGTLRDSIQTEATRICQLLNLGIDRRLLTPELDEPNVTKIGLDQPAFVGDGPEDFRTADAAVSGERPEVAKRVSRSRVFVFSDEAAVLPVFLATRAVLLRDFGQQYGSSCYATTKLDPEEIAVAENRLYSHPGYAGEPRPDPLPPARIRPHREVALETLLKAAWPRIEACGVRFGQYQSFVGPALSPQYIASWLRQFGSEDLARGALRLLEAITIMDRAFFVSALRRVLQAARDQQGEIACICPLGGTGDSSAFLSYLMNDLRDEERAPVLQLELGLELTAPGQILLWDDFCGRAGHTKTAIAQWLGRPRSEWALNEHHVAALSQERLEALRKRKITVGFALARDSGIADLRSWKNAYGAISNAVVLDPYQFVPDADNTFGLNHCFHDDRERDMVRDFLREQGRRLLVAKTTRADDPWAREELEGNLLGYGNTAQLLVFFYNVPTVTITALWAKGPGPNGVDWFPLFPRREKPAAKVA